MKLSPAGLEFLARQEGEVLHVYLDAGGKPTIGVGHLIREGEDYSAGISHAEAMALLASDVAYVEATIESGTRVDLSQTQFDALVSFAFNVGGGAFLGSALRRLLNEGDYRGAADEFPKWDHVSGKVNAGLLARRQRERALFLTGVY